MKKSTINAASMQAAAKRKNYAWFEEGTKNYNLNLFGIRTDDPAVDVFNDWLGLAWKFKGEWHIRAYPGTTDPGAHWLQNLLNPSGCAILVPGQYKGVYGLRLHRGIYEAMCQTWGPVRVFRDGNKDNELDFDSSTIMTGDYGINIHHASSGGITQKVGRFSAGCQVFQDSRDFDYCREIWRKSRANYGNKFTYTLFEEADFH